MAATAVAAACWGLAQPDVNTWQEPEAEDLGNQGYTSYKAFATALLPPNVINMHHNINYLLEMLDLDTCLTPEAKN